MLKTLNEITDAEERAGLRRIFDLGVELPIPPEMTRKVAGYIGYLEAQLAALSWTVISESNLPTEADELLDHNGNVETTESYRNWGGFDSQSWTDKSYIYRRPINAPAKEPKDE